MLEAASIICHIARLFIEILYDFEIKIEVSSLL